MVHILHSLSLQLLRTSSTDSRSLTLPMLFGFLVADKEFTFLAIALWLIFRSLHNSEDAVAFTEDRVHLFERAVCCCWKGEPDAEEYEGVAVIGG